MFAISLSKNIEPYKIKVCEIALLIGAICHKKGIAKLYSHNFNGIKKCYPLCFAENNYKYGLFGESALNGHSKDSSTNI